MIPPTMFRPAADATVPVYPEEDPIEKIVPVGMAQPELPIWKAFAPAPPAKDPGVMLE